MSTNTQATEQEQERPIRNYLLFSFNGKIVLLVGATAFFTALLLGIFFFTQTSENALRVRTGELEAEAELVSPLMQTVFTKMRSDIVFLSRTPPVQGLIRSMKNDGIDPYDGSTTSLWIKRLETIFESMIMTKDSYIQIRYIGVADEGRELVRVNKKNGEPERVPSSRLQQKADEFYFQEILKTPANAVYYSPVTLNREKGQIQKPLLPVIRSAMPIYDEDGTVFGMIVINAAYEEVLKDALKDVDIDKDIFIINKSGDFIHYESRKHNPEFFYRTSPEIREKFPFIEAVQKSGKQSGTVSIQLNDKENVAYYKKSTFSPNHHDAFSITALVAVPKHILLEPVYQTQLASLLLTTALIVLVSLVAATFAFYQVRPLKRMIRKIRGFREQDDQLDLPVDLRNEVGELARAFQILFKKLKQSRATEARARARLEAVVDSTVDGLVTIDGKGNIETFNKACETLFGYTAGEVIGKNVKMLMPEPYRSQHDAYISHYHETGEKRIIGKGREVEGRHKDGSVFPIHLSVSEVRIRGLKIYSGIIRDITEAKKAEEEILRSNEELERFAYIASHDLQEPLRMVTNFTKLLDEEYGQGMGEQAQQYMSFVTDASGRMQNLVSDLLEYSRVGSEDAGFSTFAVQEQMDYVLETLQETIDETGTKITMDEMPKTLRANPVRFSRLMQNLIGNAIKYRHAERAPKIHVGVQEQGNNWLFSVKDNGLGIKEEYLDQIFVIFKRLHNKNEYSGTGIGLAVCKKIVENFDGQLSVESEFGEGSTFSFTIPK